MSDTDTDKPPQAKSAASEEKLARVVADISAAESTNSTAYDKAILTLASAALGLSLTFTKSMVEVAHSQWLALLLLSWAGFVLTIGTVLLNFIFALDFSRRQKAGAVAVYRSETMGDLQLQQMMDRQNACVHKFNIAQGVMFLVSMVLFATYVTVNVYTEAHMSDEKKFVRPQTELIKKSAQASGIVPLSVPNIPAAGQQNTQPAAPAKTQSPTQAEPVKPKNPG